MVYSMSCVPFATLHNTHSGCRLSALEDGLQACTVCGFAAVGHCPQYGACCKIGNADCDAGLSCLSCNGGDPTCQTNTGCCTTKCCIQHRSPAENNFLGHCLIQNIVPCECYLQSYNPTRQVEDDANLQFCALIRSHVCEAVSRSKFGFAKVICRVTSRIGELERGP